jgi:energy-coupling factor transporter ATP-binding protein EcfA2
MACCWTHIFSIWSNSVLDPVEQREHKLLVNAVLDSEFLLVLGARASGKTTRLFRLSR